MNQDSFDIDCEGSLILEDLLIDGDMKSNKDICLKGKIRGHVRGDARVVVNQAAYIDGDVSCRDLFIDGVITGNVCVAAKTVMGPHAVIEGGLITVCLQITPGAVIKGGLKLKNIK